MKTITMTYKKSTKNTHVYENNDNDSPLPVIYIKRNSLPDNEPKTITVTISL